MTTTYQTSLEDSDESEDTHTRHKQTVTQTTTTKSDNETLERGQKPVSHVTTKIARPYSRSDDMEHLAHKVGQLQDMFSLMLRQTENGADNGTKPRSVTVNTTDGNPRINTTDFHERQLSNDYSSSTDYNTVAVEAQVHQPSTSTSSSTSKRSRCLKSSVVVPCHSTLYNPEKEKLTSHREPAMENARRAQSKSPESRHRTQRRARFSDNDRISVSKRHNNSSDDESSTESTDGEQRHATDKSHQSKVFTQRQDKSTDNAEQHSTTQKKHRRHSASPDSERSRSPHNTRHSSQDYTSGNTTRHSHRHQPTDTTPTKHRHGRTKTRHKRHSNGFSSSSSDRDEKYPINHSRTANKKEKKYDKTRKSSPSSKKKHRDSSSSPDKGRNKRSPSKDGKSPAKHDKTNSTERRKGNVSSSSDDQSKKPQKQDNDTNTTQRHRKHRHSKHRHHHSSTGSKSPSKNRVSGRHIKLEKYNGTTPVETFITKFKTCSDYMGWTNQDKFIHLINSLTGTAEMVIDGAVEMTFEQLVEKLRRRFGSEEQ